MNHCKTHVLMRDAGGRKVRSKQGQTNNKAKQHSTPKAVTFTFYKVKRELLSFRAFPSGRSKVIHGIIARKEGEPGNEANVNVQCD